MCIRCACIYVQFTPLKLSGIVSSSYRGNANSIQHFELETIYYSLNISFLLATFMKIEIMSWNMRNCYFKCELCDLFNSYQFKWMQHLHLVHHMLGSSVVQKWTLYINRIIIMWFMWIREKKLHLNRSWQECFGWKTHKKACTHRVEMTRNKNRCSAKALKTSWKFIVFLSLSLNNDRGSKLEMSL